MPKDFIYISDGLRQFLESFYSEHNLQSDIYKDPARIAAEFLPSYITNSEKQKQNLVKTTSNIQHPTSNIQHPTRLLDGWDCDFRFPVWCFHKPTREWHRKVDCSNPVTREIWKTSEIDIEKCKRCHDTGGSTKSLALPEPKKTLKTVKENEEYRVCKNPTCNTHVKRGSIKGYPDWLPDFCPICFKRNQASSWMKKENPQWGFDPEGGFLNG